MQLRWRQLTATMAALVMLGILSPVITSAQPGNSNSQKSKQLVLLHATPGTYNGPCPGEITFTGTIHGAPGDTVIIEWSSDDSTTGADTVVLDSRGKATVEMTMSVGSDGDTTWSQGSVELTAKWGDGTSRTSKSAWYRVKCNENSNRNHDRDSTDSDDGDDDDSSRVSVTVSPEEFEGPCPTEITFTGTITGEPGDTVTVDWNRSDSATGTPETVVLDSTGTATVTTTWTLGGDGSEIEGWQSLTVTYPDGTTETSDQAEFSVDCDDSTENDDDSDSTDSEDREMKISIHATPGAWVGPCPGTITFTAKVMGMPGDTVTVNWNRSDSATGTAETVVLDENGHATVTMTWTLGGDDLSEYEGWASLTATWPDGTEVTSREAKFKVKCKDNGRFNADERGRGPDID